MKRLFCVEDAVSSFTQVDVEEWLKFRFSYLDLGFLGRQLLCVSCILVGSAAVKFGLHIASFALNLGLSHMIWVRCTRFMSDAHDLGLLHMIWVCCTWIGSVVHDLGLLHLILVWRTWSWTVAHALGLLHLSRVCCTWVGSATLESAALVLFFDAIGLLHWTWMWAFAGIWFRWAKFLECKF